jgi:hypothetical protein
MILTKAILKEAEKWLGCKTKDPCSADIKRLYNGVVNSEAWCCKFVWAMTNEACKKLGVANPLPQTASTKTLLENAKKTLRVDGEPAVGSIFYNTRDGGGHVGFVIKVDGINFESIEGNTTNSAGEWGVWSKKKNLNEKKYQFIHLEDLDSFENNLLAPLQFDFEMILPDPRSYISAGIVLTGGFVAWRLYKKYKK